MKKIVLALVFATTVLVGGCYYDVEEELYPPVNVCTTPATVSFAQHVNPLLQSYGCIGCHNTAAPSGNVNMANYNGVKAKVNDGRLWGAINHMQGFSPMPQGGNKMAACDLATIRAWIDAGALNN